MNCFDEWFIDSNLPKPFSQTEVVVYFKKYKDGDMSAREEIINRNIRLVLNRVKTFGNTNYEEKELVSVGLIGLIKSVDSFDISKNIKFVTYAVKCIDNEILLYLRKTKKYVNVESLDRTIFVGDHGKEMSVMDTLIDESIDFVRDEEKKELYLMMYKMIDELSDLERMVVMFHFGFIGNGPYSQVEIARWLGVSQSYVSRLISKIVVKMRNRLQMVGMIEVCNKNKRKVRCRSKC